MSYEGILKMFCARDSTASHRFKLTDVFTKGEWTVGTDGWQMACVPSEILSVPTEGEVPNVQAIFDTANYRTPFEIDLSRLYSRKAENQLRVAPIEPKHPIQIFEPCAVCDAKKLCSCSCRGEHYCSACGGKGEKETRKSALLMKLYQEEMDAYRTGKIKIPAVWFSNAAFDYRLLKNIREACKKLKVKTLTIEAHGSRSALIARTGYMKFVVMPLGAEKSQCVEL